MSFDMGLGKVDIFGEGRGSEDEGEATGVLTVDLGSALCFRVSFEVQVAESACRNGATCLRFLPSF